MCAAHMHTIQRQMVNNLQNVKISRRLCVPCLLVAGLQNNYMYLRLNMCWDLRALSASRIVALRPILRGISENEKQIIPSECFHSAVVYIEQPESRHRSAALFNDYPEGVEVCVGWYETFCLHESAFMVNTVFKLQKSDSYSVKDCSDE